MNEKISVIVPVYNVEPYLERCLDSIINNTYRNLEIICVDDGSPDGCGAILDRYAQMDERFVVIHKENGGVSSARNRGLDVAMGEYIAFIDPDDWVHPQYFQILLNLQKRDNYDLVICNSERPTDVGTYILYDVENVDGTNLSLEGIYNNWKAKTYVWGKLYRKSLIGNTHFDETIRRAEDVAFNGAVFGKDENMRGYHLSVPLYFYYDRSGSLAGQLKDRETLSIGEIFEVYAKEASAVASKKVFLMEAMKRGLSARYGLTLCPEEREFAVRSNLFIRRALKEYLVLPNISWKEKLQYAVLGYLPFSYRLFRIIDDPTLLQMEKNIKAQNKREA